jgi:hypothetical protein
MLVTISFFIRPGDQSCPSACAQIFAFKTILSDLTSFIKLSCIRECVDDFGLLNQSHNFDI